MGFCPNCKLEYVEGVKVCPDCKTALVESLEDINEVVETDDLVDNEYEGEIEEVVRPFMNSEMSDEEKLEYVREMMKKLKGGPAVSYKSKEDEYSNNMSGAGVLIACGLLGAVFLILNGFNVFNVPLHGFSLTLMNVVMGCLFFIFLASGIRSIFKLKSLKIEVENEKKTIEEVLSFIKENKKAGKYSYSKDDNFEAGYLELSENVVNDVNNQFPDLEEGFAFYIVDRFAGDILDED